VHKIIQEFPRRTTSEMTLRLCLISHVIYEEGLTATYIQIPATRIKGVKGRKKKCEKEYRTFVAKWNV